MIVFYEYMITFGEEVELFWSKTMNGATILFLATRYLNTILYLYMFITQVWPPGAIDGPVSFLSGVDIPYYSVAHSVHLIVVSSSSDIYQSPLRTSRKPPPITVTLPCLEEPLCSARSHTRYGQVRPSP